MFEERRTEVEQNSLKPKDRRTKQEPNNEKGERYDCRVVLRSFKCWDLFYEFI